MARCCVHVKLSCQTCLLVQTEANEKVLVAAPLPSTSPPTIILLVRRSWASVCYWSIDDSHKFSLARPSSTAETNMTREGDDDGTMDISASPCHGIDSFMTLVDAAASLLDSAEEEAPASPRPQHPAMSPATTKRSSSSTTTTHNAKTFELMGVNKKQTFAEELMDILENEANHDVLDWMPDGLAFTVVNHRKFTLERMPKLFKIHNMSSFVRKLTRWGFQRVHDSDTRNSDVFKHPSFQRGKRDLLRQVKCLGVGPVGAHNVPVPPTAGPRKPQVIPLMPVTPKKKFKAYHSKGPKTMIHIVSPTKENLQASIPVTPGTPSASPYQSTSWSSAPTSTSPSPARLHINRSMYERLEPPLVQGDGHRASTSGMQHQRLMVVAGDSRLPQSLRSRLMAVALESSGSGSATDPPVCYPYGPPVAWTSSESPTRHAVPHTFRSNGTPSPHSNDLMRSVPPRFFHYGSAPGYMH